VCETVTVKVCAIDGQTAKAKTICLPKILGDIINEHSVNKSTVCETVNVKVHEVDQSCTEELKEELKEEMKVEQTLILSLQVL
jgi:hypothetical protein